MMKNKWSILQDEIAGQWQRFCADGEVDRGVIRDFILESWLRSRHHGVDPLNVEGHQVDEKAFSAILSARHNLIRIGLPVIEKLFAFIKGSRSIIILADENGIILNRTGDPEYLTNSKSYEPGIEYSERTVGTNGIGTCIFLDQPVQIWAEEHYCKRNHELCCAAAPIHDPQGKLVGCLNLSCLWDTGHTHTLGMVAAAANAIEQQIRIESVLENKIELLQEKQGIFELISDGLLTIDRTGKITDINEQARRMLGIGADGGRGEPLERHILSGVNFQAIIEHGSSIYDQDATLKLVGGVLPCIISATPIAKSAGLVITIREAKTIRRMVNRYAGSRAILTFDDIVGVSPQLMESIRLAKIAGKSSTNTLILGESGTGKEIFAQAIHNGGNRKNGPFVAINCGALPRDLIQSELFGYAEGAFTGAKKQGNPGKFELADGGTIFLDEIGEMPLSAQVNLLRVVENKEVVRVGDQHARPVDVRIIAATNRSLMQAIVEKTFREDLYYRLNVLTINLPPLRLRTGDLEVLAGHFLQKVCRATGRAVPAIAGEVYAALRRYSWPGNIRELENVIERAVNISPGSSIGIDDLSRDITLQSGRSVGEPDVGMTMVSPLPAKVGHLACDERESLQDGERAAILRSLSGNRGNMRRSAADLGIARSTLYEKIRKFGIDPGRHR
ncbi:MAG: sigma-54-dependent Fis family transcriptional regulator [Proteobacteria bacterium]|nr:sigma-54-dependent Fis family transcriptional regulator [Pseudomonadota bacterium]